MNSEPINPYESPQTTTSDSVTNAPVPVAEIVAQRLNFLELSTLELAQLTYRSSMIYAVDWLYQIFISGAFIYAMSVLLSAMNNFQRQLQKEYTYIAVGLFVAIISMVIVQLRLSASRILGMMIDCIIVTGVTVWLLSFFSNSGNGSIPIILILLVCYLLSRPLLSRWRSPELFGNTKNQHTQLIAELTYRDGHGVE